MDSSRPVPPASLSDRDPVQARHHLQLEPLPRLVSTARAFVRDHVPSLPEETVDVLLLLTSELVTNAVIHARTVLELEVVLSDSSVVVTVHDLDLSRPQQQPYADREGGWGLALVSALAEDYAIDVHPGGGKTAWFRLARGRSPAVASDSAERGRPNRTRATEAHG